MDNKLAPALMYSVLAVNKPLYLSPSPFAPDPTPCAPPWSSAKAIVGLPLRADSS